MQLREELTVPFLAEKYGYPIYLCPFLIPALIIRHNLSSCDIEKYLLDRIIKRESGNALRVFLDAGTWSKQSKKNTYQPIIQDKNDVYQLPLPENAETEIINYINPDWLNQIIDRIKLIVERHIQVILTLRDDTTIHNMKKTHWALHWLNPDNNNQDLHFKNISIYHYPEWSTNPNIPPQNRQKAINTGLIVEATEDEILRLIFSAIKPKYRKYITIEAGNEVSARINWHKIKDALCQSHRVPRKMKDSDQTHYRRLTSMGQARKPHKDRWQKYRTHIYEQFNYSVHDMANVADIEEVISDWKKTEDENGNEIKPIRAKFLPSCDGGNYPSPPMARKMAKKSLETGNFGLELLEGLWGGVELKDLNFKPSRGMMRAFNAWNA